MNLQILKTLAFWLTAIPTIIGLLMTSGAILSGSTLEHVIGWVLAIVGALGGHSVASQPTQTPAA